MLGCIKSQHCLSVRFVGVAHRENQSAEAATINTVCKPRRPAGGFFVIPQPPPWLNLRRKPELDLLPLELDFLYGVASLPVQCSNTGLKMVKQT